MVPRRSSPRNVCSYIVLNAIMLHVAISCYAILFQTSMNACVGRSNAPILHKFARILLVRISVLVKKVSIGKTTSVEVNISNNCTLRGYYYS